jgi:hypothetical protein
MDDRIKLALVLFLIIIAGAIFYFYYFEPMEQKQIESKYCEIGKEYNHTAISPVKCICPPNYEFETVSTAWGPCRQPGMQDCPASILKCSQKK